MAINTIITFITILILAFTDNGFVKLICLGVLTIAFFVFIKICEKELENDTRKR